MGSKVALLFLGLFMFMGSLSVFGLEFDVGGEDGWVVPADKNVFHYNHWASKFRFMIGDTVRFKYDKDSVVVVETEKQYEECKSEHPLFFSNSGDTTYNLNRSGPFYFISGVTGHCRHGQRMIVQVLAPLEGPTGSPAGKYDDNGRGDMKVVSCWIVVFAILLGFLLLF